MHTTSLFPIGTEYAEYLHDESRSVGTAEEIAFPTSEQEIQSLVAEKYGEGQKITVQGARTGLAAAAVPNGGLILNLSKMNHVLGMREDGRQYYLTVEPGVILSELRKMIAKKQFDTTGWTETSIQVYSKFCKDHEFCFFPDPTEVSASIGGMTACNASGARSYRYGSVRNHVSALRMITPDGRIISIRRGESFANEYKATFKTTDGELIPVTIPNYQMPDTKNASGYFARKNMDLIDLLIGSDGTLGIFSQIELVLSPLPAFIWGVSCMFSNEQQALQFVEMLRNEKTPVASIEYFDADALQVLRRQRERGTAFSGLPVIETSVNAIVYVELHCDEYTQTLSQLQSVGNLFESAGGNKEQSWVACNENDLNRLMFFRHAVPESVNMLIDQRRKADPSITKLGSDMSVPDNCLRQVVQMYRNTLQENKLESAIWGHIGNNHLHVNVLPNNAEEYNRAKQLFKSWAVQVSKMGGAVSAEHGVGKLKPDFLTIMYKEDGIEQMRKCKEAFDAKGLLGTGNLFSRKDGSIV